MLPILRGLPNWLARLAGQPQANRGDDAGNSAADFARLNRVVPLQNAKDGQDVYLRREAILNREERIAGYEFSLLRSLRPRLRKLGGMAKRAYDAGLLDRLVLHGVTTLLGHRLAFVSLSAESIGNTLIEQLPLQNTVLMLEVAQETSDLESITARIGELKRKGFTFGLRIRDAAGKDHPLIGEFEFIQIDVTGFDGIDLRSLAGELKKKCVSGTSPPRLIARDVQSHDDFQFCIKCGFDFFQGSFITSRESLLPTSGGINRMAVLPILNMVRGDQNFALIAGQLKNEPSLTYKLLRYMNSPAMGLRQPIDSLTEALVLIGREKFYRWMSLLLFDIANPSYRERALAERALTRGRTLELLAGMGHIPNAGDHLFLIGLFSLLDLALGRPLPELLEKATLPDAVRTALLGKAGPYADALALAVVGEADAAILPDQIAQALERCGIADTAYAPAAAQALVWANQALGDAGYQEPHRDSGAA